MDYPERLAMLSGFIPNGLLPNKATSLAKVLDQDRWSRAEKRTAELLTQIQPNQTSEEQRNAVVSYLQRLIMKCAPCQVFTYGSVPLKTYLPDGDIDLTAFSDNQNLKDSLVHEVRDILERQKKSENAEFLVKEVQYIQAEVKIIKCLVENIVVDISFNQLGGLCTLCFLEEVDNMIRQNHLFKRSIILIKAWCYYESRILGAHHGLISTYALETLVLYIFRVYSSTFAGPLEVLYRFLDFFSKFDWDNYCISLWGPVPIGSLPNMTAEPPRKDCQELLLSESFLNACNSCYGVMPRSQENQEQPFVSKYFNIIDPLCANNNLGRSISKGNFFRIRSAIAFGAQRLVRLLDCPEENLIAEFDFFFRNTWDRHGKGHWLDLSSYHLYSRNNNVENSTHHESEIEQAQASHGSDGVYQKPANHLKESKQMVGTSDASAVSQTWSTKTNNIFTGTMTSEIKHASSMKNALTDKGQSSKYSSNEVHAMHQFARVHSSPEFAHLSSEVLPQHKHTGASETENGQIHSASSMIDNSRRSSSRSEVLDNHNIRVSAENQHSFGQISYDWRSEDAVDSKNTSNSYHCEFGLGGNNENGLSVDEAMRMHQKEHDFMNITETYRNHSFNGYLQAPVNVNSSNVSFPLPPPVLASGYTHANSFGVLPVNVPSYESFWGHNLPYSQGLVPLPALPWFPSLRTTLNQEEITEPVDYHVVAAHLYHDNSNEGFWSEQDMNTVRVYDDGDGNIQAQQQSDRQMVATSGSSFGNSSWLTSSGSYSPKDYGETTEHKWLTRENDSNYPPDERTIDSDVNSTASSRYTPALPSTSRTKLSSFSFSNGSTLPTSQPLDTDSAYSTTAETVTSDVQAHQFASYMQRPMIVSNSSIPDTPVLVSPGSSQTAVDNQELLPFAFGPSGPPFPFPNVFPFYNLPTETGIPYTAANHIGMDAELGNLHASLSSVSSDPSEKSRLSDTFHKSNYSNYISHDATLEPFVKQSSDILNGDFACHWLNLQYGRFCQNAQLQGPLPYLPAVVPPMYLHLRGQFPWRVPRRPPAFMNSMAHGPPLVPMMPIQHIHGSHAGINQLIADGLPRQSVGTGTYLPDPISYQNRYYRRKRYSNTKNQRGNYRYEKKDHHGEREENWNFNSEEMLASRGQFSDLVERMDKTNLSIRRPNRQRNSSKHGSFSGGESRNGSFNTSTPNKHFAANMPCDIHPPPIISTSTNEASYQGEGSHSAFHELKFFERDSADSSSHKPSSSNFLGILQDKQPSNKQRC